jgi:putative transposase
VLADKKGVPLSIVITSANTHDMKATAETLDRIVTKRPLPPPKKKKHRQQNLCLDKGYNYPEIEQEVVKRGYVPHIRHRGEGKKSVKKKRRHHPTRRWVIERTNSWHNRFRKLLVRYEKKAENYLGLVHLSCCITVYRRIILG